MPVPCVSVTAVLLPAARLLTVAEPAPLSMKPLLAGASARSASLKPGVIGAVLAMVIVAVAPHHRRAVPPRTSEAGCVPACATW